LKFLVRETDVVAVIGYFAAAAKPNEMSLQLEGQLVNQATNCRP